MTVFAFGAKTNFMVNLETAQYKAGVEGKLYMVHFTASWCTPCKWMNSHTFTDERVSNYLSEFYVPVKINVDDFDGILIKQKNNVQFLPTLLIFNSKGEEVGRFEEAIGPSKLMLILEENNIPLNREKVDLPEPAAAVAPEAISRPILPSIFDDTDKNVSSGEASVIEKPTAPVERERVVYTAPEFNRIEDNITVEEPNIEEAIKVETPRVEVTKVEETIIETPTVLSYPEPVASNAAPKPDATSPIAAPTYPSSTTSTSEAAESLAFLTGEGIFELDVKYKKKEGYSVQIGLYARYENVLSEVNKFSKMYGQQIYVHIGKKNGVPVYRLLMGSFSDKGSANKLEFDLKAKGLDCFVNDLSRI